MNEATLITREEIAELLGITARMVRTNEVRWGLRVARVDLNCRVVRYRRRQAMEALTGFGVAKLVATRPNSS